MKQFKIRMLRELTKNKPDYTLNFYEILTENLIY